MSIEYVKIPGDRLTAHIICADVNSEREIANAFSRMDEALAGIMENLGAEKNCFFGIEVQEAEVSDIPHPCKAYQPKERYPENWYNPWRQFSPAFWYSAIKGTTTREYVKDWLVKVEAALTSGNARYLAAGGMFEESYTQFAEPLVSNLAIWDLAFVPYYTRLLRLWDLHAEVHQVGVVDAIVRKFGRCAEVEELIFARVAETESQHGIEQLDDLYPFLQEQYGDFASSDLFYRIVSRLYADDKKFRSENENAVEMGLLVGCENPKLEEVANQIAKQLDAVN